MPNKIKEIVLKANMVVNGDYKARPLSGDKIFELVPGGPMKYIQGLPILIGEEECFVHEIRFHRKNSDFVKRSGFSTGCYIIRFAAGSNNYCIGKTIDQVLIIMEDVVATVLFFDLPDNL